MSDTPQRPESKICMRCQRVFSELSGDVLIQTFTNPEYEKTKICFDCLHDLAIFLRNENPLSAQLAEATAERDALKKERELAKRLAGLVIAHHDDKPIAPCSICIEAAATYLRALPQPPKEAGR